MNKNIFVSMLDTSIFILVLMYIAKIFFPEEFVFVIENERIVAIGDYIDSHIFLRYLCAAITSFITYYLFCCACANKKFLNLKQTLIIIISIVLLRIISFLDVNIATHASICLFFILPYIFKSSLKIATIIYSVHGLAQVLSMSIRNLPMYLTSANYVTVFLIGIECYFWLLLFYIIFNYKKGDLK